MWYPPLPNNGEVKVTIMAGDTETVYFLSHYQTLNIEPFIEHNGNKYYLLQMLVNDEDIICTPKLYLDEHINEVLLNYYDLKNDELGMVLESIGGVISLKNYLPQIGGIIFGFSFPRAYTYKDVIINGANLGQSKYAFPVDLDKEDFEVWENGIKFTLHLNRDNKLDEEGWVFVFFEIIKAEFYGELLPTEELDDVIELKPKGE